MFLRFHLRQPLADALTQIDQHLANPTWKDDAGKIDPGHWTFVSRGAPGSRNEFGVVKLERKHDGLLRFALANPTQPSLHHEILSDAQAAAFDGNVRRAVLELAIACEVFAKHKFFDGDISADLFEVLEDKGKIAVRTLDLIDIGTSMTGKSFRLSERGAYIDIDHLFRARNKVAHRGTVVFRDDRGALHTVDLALLRHWWRSVEKLFSWAD